MFEEKKVTAEDKAIVMEYRIHKLKEDLKPQEFASRKKAVPAVQINCYPWKNDYCPKTEARAAYTDLFFYVVFRVFEDEVIARHGSFQDPVYEDSCVELFFNPFPEAASDYINLEMNAAGVLLAQIGPDRENRRFLKEHEIQNLEIHAPWIEKRSVADAWEIALKVPFSLFSRLYARPFTFPRSSRGNFYKCGDKTAMPHYGCWSLVRTPAPDFHRPEFFGIWFFA